MEKKKKINCKTFSRTVSGNDSKANHIRADPASQSRGEGESLEGDYVGDPLIGMGLGEKKKKSMGSPWRKAKKRGETQKVSERTSPIHRPNCCNSETGGT